MMRKIKFSFVSILLMAVTISLTGCIPPFIDGLVDNAEYLNDHTECAIFTIDYDAEGGFTEGVQSRQRWEFEGDSGARAQYRKITFFTTSKMQEIKIAGIVFMVSPDRDTTLSFRLSLNGKSEEQSVFVARHDAATLFFDNLNVSWSSSQANDGKIEIQLLNVLENYDVSYAIGSFLLIAAG